MRRGFILPLLFLIFILAGTYYLYSKYSRSPNQTTKEAAATIYKYPNQKTWEIKPHHNVCLTPANACIQPVDVVFTTDDNWPTVYNYYKTYFTDNDWSTNSTVYTSIPTSIVFNNNSCDLALEPQKGSFLTDNTPKGPPFTYTFSMSCK